MNQFIKMNNIKRGIPYIIIGGLLALLLNYFVIEEVLIPDPCYYHINSPSILFSLFYGLPSYAGGHPVPTLFNFVFTGILGGIVGWKIFKKIS